MPKISFVIGEMRRGGAERVISVLANNYAQHGWNVDIITLFGDNSEYKLDNRIKIRFISSNVDSNNYYKSSLSWIPQIRNYVIKEKPDYIVPFITRIGLLTIISTLGLNCSIIVSERNDPKHDRRSLLIRILTNLLFPRAYKVVFQTLRVQSYYSKRIRSNSVVIENPISVSVKAGIPSKRIISAGRLQPQKNQKLLINAFSDFIKIQSDYSLTIYGEGPLRKDLEKLILDLGLQNKVFLPGNINDLHQQYIDADMFVLSSDYEGMSNALMEAMMIGLPCVSTKCAGSDEIIQDHLNGLLVDVKDQESLCEAMLEIATNRELNNRLREKAIETSHRFSHDSIFEKWNEITKI